MTVRTRSHPRNHRFFPFRRANFRPAEFVVLAALLAAPAASFAQDTAPGFRVTGEADNIDGWITAKATARVTVQFPPDKTRLTIRGKAGTDRSGFQFSLRDAAGGTTNYVVRSQDYKISPTEIYPDGYLEIQWQTGRSAISTRPSMVQYGPAKRKELFATWDTFPAASSTAWTLEFRRGATGTELWANGQFLQPLPMTAAFASADFRLRPGCALHDAFADDPPTPDRGAANLLPLPTATYARPGAMADAQIKLLADASLPTALAPPAKPGAGSIAVDGLGRLAGIGADDLVSFAWRRSALQALPDARVFDVPLATYSYADILCAAEIDPAKVPSFTARLTRYGSSMGDALADSTVTLPLEGETPGTGTRQVGAVTYGAAPARKTVPLWLVRVPLKNGRIQELISGAKDGLPAFRSPRYLDFEILDPVPNVDSTDQFPPPMTVTQRGYTPGTARSAVHIFAAALERSPATLTTMMNLPVQVAYAAEKPEWRAVVDAREPGDYQVQWDFADVDGKIVTSGKKTVTVSAAKPTETLAVPITAETGWYATRFRLSDAKGEELADNRSAFVIVPPDTRHAGFESPYGTWWFSNSHGGEPDFDRVGPLLQKAGLRHTTLPTNLPEAVTKNYGVTNWHVPWRPSKKPLVADKVADYEEHIRNYLALWPSVNKMMVWHESGDGGAPFPSEIWGETPRPLSAASQKNWQERIEFLTALAKMVRAKFPGLKMQYGNDGSSVNMIGELLRLKFPREYIDTIASEELGQTMPAEWGFPGSVQSTWYLRETARALGYPDIPVTAAYEWINRRSPTLGLEAQAEWYARDGLTAQAYGFDTIALGTINDAGAGYFHTPWGAGGLTRRYPLMEPKPAYLALAAQTRILDRAKYEREVPTGLLSLYALEFRRGPDWVYALWTPRVRHAATLHFPAGSSLTLADLYGREKSLTGPDANVTLSPAVQYLVSSMKLTSFSAGTLVDQNAPPATATIVDAMDKAANWTVDKNPKYEQASNFPYLKNGDFELREVNDAKMGKCLELELKPTGVARVGTQEYAVLTLAQPPGKTMPANDVGVWVKGDGGSGDVDFILSLDGIRPRFTTANIRNSWTGAPAANFDGWYFRSYPLSSDTRWADTGKGNVVGLIVKIPRQVLHLTEMKPVPEPKIRLKGLSLF